MTDTEKVERVECYVKTVLPAGGPAFAVRADNGETVYIPAKVSIAAQLRATDHITALIGKNKVRPDNTPWFARTIMVIDTIGRQPNNMQE